MGLTSALNTSLNGLSLNETAIDVLGNNIANAGTNGFKASTVQFTTQLARTLSVGSRPTADNGGTNPRQIGLGANVAAINKDFAQGAITNSTSPSDLAIQGDGFFILDGSAGVVYSRNGNFNLNSEDKLVNHGGARVQGFIVDRDTLELGTVLEDIEIRLGRDRAVRETDNVIINGSLKTSSDADVAADGSIFTSNAFTNVAGGVAGANPVVGGTLLTSMYDDGSVVNLFAVGDELNMTGRKGERDLEEQTLTITAATDVDDLLAFIEGVLGIATTADDPGILNDSSGNPTGVTITAGGEIMIVGNAGDLNDIDLAQGDFTITVAGVATALDLGLSSTAKTQDAAGESAILNFPVFDSLGEQINVKATAYLESRNASSATFRYILESFDDSRADTVIGTGTITFDGDGNVIAGDTIVTSVFRDNTSANTLQFQIDFSAVSGIVASSDPSTLNLSSQDGSGPGVLTNFVIDESGFINGVFDNGIILTLGRIALARFANSQGLVEVGGTSFQEGVASGPANVLATGTNGAGTLRSGAIELSNTDIGRSLVELIVASTNYRGNARIISSVQQLVDELLVLGR